MMTSVFWDDRVSWFDGMRVNINSWRGMRAFIKLRRAIQNWWHRELSYGVTFLHVKERPQAPTLTKKENKLFHLELSDFSPDSTGFKLSDFFLSLHLKQELVGKGFKTRRNSRLVVFNWFSFQAANFYTKRIKKLVPRYEKGLENGELMQKWIFCF